MIPKFRAWDKVFKEMVQVNALVLDEQVVKVTYKNGNVAKEDMKEYELMQSTGLFDRNGKEVFVGDIVKCTRGCHHEVYLEKEYGGTFIGGMPAIYLKGLLSGYAWTEDEEIIGNIYENPELLGVEE
nr:MAG TPA: YopX protein [Caudoviricetes sp.]